MAYNIGIGISYTAIIIVMKYRVLRAPPAETNFDESGFFTNTFSTSTLDTYSYAFFHADAKQN